MVRILKREKASILIMVIAIAMAFQIIMVEAPDYLPVLRISTDDVYLTAGEVSEIKFNLTNMGTWDIYEAKISISVPSTTPGVSLLEDYHKVYNKIKGGALKSFVTQVYVDQDTPIGAYSLTLQATYMQKVKYGVEMLESSTIQIGIVVDSVSRLSYRMSAEAEDPVFTAGADNQLNVVLGNLGDATVHKIDATVSSTSPYIVVLEGSRFTHGSLDANMSVMHPAIVRVSKNTPLGVYTLSETVVYEDESGQSYSESFVVGITVDSVSRLSYRMSAEAEDPVFTAGADNQLNVVLGNLGDATVHKIDATVSSTSPYIVVLEGSRFTHGSLDANMSVMHPAIVRVSKNTPLGVYTLSETVVYEDESGQSYSESFVVGITVDSSTLSNPLLSVSVKYPQLIAGADNPITVNLLNIGSERLLDIEVTLVSASPYLVILEGGRINIDELDLEERFSADVVIAVSRSALVGVYTLSTSSSYQGPDGQGYIEASTLGVSVESVEVPVQTSVVMSGYNLSIDPVRPGDRFSLVLELDSLGSDAHDVKVALSLDPLTGISTMSPTLVSLDGMDLGERSEAKFDLLVSGDVRAGQYPGIVTITYLDADGLPRSFMETVTLSVRGIVEFKLINIGTVTVGIGDSVEFEADMLLVGTESVQFVNIEVVEDSVFQRTVESEEYIGAVDPDSPIPFEVQFRVAEGADVGKHNLILRITYQDDLNQQHVETLELTVDVEEVRSQGNIETSSIGGFWVWLRKILGLGP